MAGKYNDSKVNEDEAFFLSRNDLINRWGNIVSSWSFLPGLVGFWPMSSVQRSTGNAYDVSGQNRILTYNGNPTYNIYNNFVPYIDFDGVGDYLARADETDLDIIGTEAINAAAIRGLTIGGWFWINAFTANNQRFISKGTSAGNLRSYSIASVPAFADDAQFLVSVDGINTITVNLDILPAAWNFIIGRYIPSTELKIWVNNNTNINVVAVPASIFNSNVGMAIGGWGDGTQLIAGRASLCFLSHQTFSDALINAMFQQSRILFGV